MSKTKTLRALRDPNQAYSETLNIYRNKYYNAFRRQIKVNGLNYRQADYLFNKFYGSGTVAAFRIPSVDELGLAPWVMQTWDMYNEPETVMLTNEHGSPLIPSTVQVVDKDVVIGYIQRNKKPVSLIVDWYVKRIAAAEMTINTNLQLQKLPYLIPTDEDQSKIEDIVQRILNDDIVVTAPGIDPSLFKVVPTGAPYVIDKLYNYKMCLENELRTYLGIDNAGEMKMEQTNLDQTNADNSLIEDGIEGFMECLDEFAERVKSTFGITISFERTSKPVISITESHSEGSHNYPDERNSSKEGDSNGNN